MRARARSLALIDDGSFHAGGHARNMPPAAPARHSGCVPTLAGTRCLIRPARPLGWGAVDVSWGPVPYANTSPRARLHFEALRAYTYVPAAGDPRAATCSPPMTSASNAASMKIPTFARSTFHGAQFS